jgi:hypothetical protein
MDRPHLSQIYQFAIEGDLNLDLGHEEIFINGCPRYLDTLPFNYAFFAQGTRNATYEPAEVHKAFANTNKRLCRCLHRLEYESKEPVWLGLDARSVAWVGVSPSGRTRDYPP